MTIGQWVAGQRKQIAQGNWALLPLRLMVGFGFAAHGYAKLARGPATFAPILIALGVPAPFFTAWATSLVEFAGGILMMLGAFVVPLSLPLAAMIATAMFGVHVRYGFLSIRLQALSAAGAQFGPIGYELDLLYLVAIATLALGGSSPLSVDRWLEARNSRLNEEVPAASKP
ncbi:MAG TPA: DoxX family protein [Candidatus Eisenbacteria bacterium]|nr:DoxX family protein [Candidatus Eisenbacteria bacterium]